ncbi:TVP38/TMEM64 family protein [Solibacillus sp. MA9]|uniref:TVP38/TMEM64 family membrane protein n=1 Tax=Solibacillus palustris TaxID=2908203 RepID=A0ABS9U932_9BACL|nr:TVP38/TMEM64 family protein [Solibacillus sp. MA9]
MFDWISIDNVELLIEKYKLLGPWFSVFLTSVEAFLPFLPLFVIVVANAGAYGLFWGFMLSWLATVVGSYLFFLMIRYFGNHRLLQKLKGQKQVKQLIHWVDVRGFTPLFVLLCLPFTPIVVVNTVAGLSHLKKKYYFLTLLISKPVMIFLISYLGSDLRAILSSPMKIVVSCLIIAVIWALGKWIERYLTKRVERDLRNIKSRK